MKTDFAQGDIIWINFDPSRGREIQKRRPALVISRTEYNKATGFLIVCPITSTFRKGNPTYFPLDGYKTSGFIATVQLYTMDANVKSGRNPEYIEAIRTPDLLSIQQMIQNNFGF